MWHEQGASVSCCEAYCFDSDGSTCASVSSGYQNVTIESTLTSEINSIKNSVNLDSSSYIALINDTGSCKIYLGELNCYSYSDDDSDTSDDDDSDSTEVSSINLDYSTDSTNSTITFDAGYNYTSLVVFDDFSYLDVDDDHPGLLL